MTFPHWGLHLGPAHTRETEKTEAKEKKAKVEKGLGIVLSIKSKALIVELNLMHS